MATQNLTTPAGLPPEIAALPPEMQQAYIDGVEARIGSTDRHRDHRATTEDNIQTLRSIFKSIALLSEDAAESRDISQLAQVGDFYCDCLRDNIDDFSMLLKEADKREAKS